jgi:hypothetical protein
MFCQNDSVAHGYLDPGAFLHALGLPAVTNGRASGDYIDSVGNLLQYGTSAVFFAAVGIGLGRIVALYHRPSTSYQIHLDNRCLYYFLLTAVGRHRPLQGQLVEHAEPTAAAPPRR